MEKKELFELFKKQAQRMIELPYPVGKDVNMFLDTGEGIYAIDDDADFADFSEDDIVQLELEKLPIGDPNMKAMVFSKTPFLQFCLKHQTGFFAPLDDMAQIVGRFVKLVKEDIDNVYTSKKIEKATKKTAACLVLTDVIEADDDDPEEDSYSIIEGFTVTAGRNLDEAVTCLTVLEKCAHISISGAAKMVNTMGAKLIRSFYLKHYSKGKINGFTHQSKEGIPDWEMEAREDLLKYCKKLVETGLVQGTWGNISLRLDADTMLITPSGLDYFELLPEDMVKVNFRTLEYEGSLKPSAEKGMHAEIYKKRIDVNAVVHAHSLYCSAFAAAHVAIPVTSKSDQEHLGEIINLAGYGISGTKGLSKNVAFALDKNGGALMSNHGMVAAGDSIEEAYDNALRMENIARSLYVDYDKEVDKVLKEEQKILARRREKKALEAAEP